MHIHVYLILRELKLYGIRTFPTMFMILEYETNIIVFKMLVQVQYSISMVHLGDGITSIS